MSTPEELRNLAIVIEEELDSTPYLFAVFLIRSDGERLHLASNIDRGDLRKALKEWISKETAQ